MKRTRTQLFLIVTCGLALVTSLLIYCQFQRTLQLSERLVSERLMAIATTLAPQLDAEELLRIQSQFGELQQDTSSLTSDPGYQSIHAILNDAFSSNELKTPIYTLSFDSLEQVLHLGISSHSASTYGLHYDSNVDQHLDLYDSGGVIPPYQDEHGTWLSAIVPLRLNNGEQIGALEVDFPFDDFVMYANDDMVKNIWLAVSILLVILTCLFFILRKLFLLDEERSEALEKANKEVKLKNEDLESGIRYAARIQSSLRPNTEELSSFFSDHMVLDLPKDTVSGDFHWFSRLDENRALIAVVDCTGHGVPGAMMAMMGYDLLNDAVSIEGLTSPKEILKYLDRRICDTFNSQQDYNPTDGMDMGICLVDRQSLTLTYGGARRPLSVLSSSEVKTISGTRRSIGENLPINIRPEFENVVMKIDKENRYFIYSDGLQDQFGGELSKKIGRKRLTNWLHNLGTSLKLDGKPRLAGILHRWKGPEQQIDDICLVGFSI